MEVFNSEMEDLNKTLKILYLVDNFGYSQSTSVEAVENVVFNCFINECGFETRDLGEMLDNHLDCHNEKWLGFCYACNAQVYTKKVSLLTEIKHMAEAHCHRLVNNGNGITIHLCEDFKTELQETVNAARKRKLSIAPTVSACDDNSTIVLKPWKNPTIKKKLSKRCLYGLYKCMDKNCAFFTSSAELMSTHLHDHECGFSKMDFPSDQYWHECAYCDLISDSSSILVQHIRDEHSSSLYQCPYCLYRSCAAYNVVFHLKKFHESRKKLVLVCNGKEIHSSAAADIDKNRLENICPLRCSNACTKITYVMDHFINHMKNSTEHDNSSFECQFCGEDISISEATKHLLRHNIGIYQCIYCREPYGANDIDGIQNHMCHTHPDQLPYICVRLTRKHVRNENLASVESAIISKLIHTVDSELLERCPFTEEQLNSNSTTPNSYLPRFDNASNNPWTDCPPEIYDLLSFNDLEKEYTSDDWDEYIAALADVSETEKDVNCNYLVDAAQDISGCVSERVDSFEEKDRDHMRVHDNQPHPKTPALSPMPHVDLNEDILALRPSDVEEKIRTQLDLIEEIDQLQSDSQADVQDPHFEPYNETFEAEQCNNTTIIPSNKMNQFDQSDIVEKTDASNVRTSTPVNRKVQCNKAETKKRPTAKKKLRNTKVAEDGNPEMSQLKLTEIVKYKCEYCRECCMNSKMIYEHWKKKHETNGAKFMFKIIKIFKCFYCRHCNTYDDLKTHCKLKHAKPFAMVDNTNPLNCGLCECQFKNDHTDIIDHFTECHNEDGVSHKIKLETYLTEELLDRIAAEKVDFLPQQNGQIMYGCSNPGQKQKCNETNCNESEIVAHIRQHNLLFKCNYCDKRLGSMIKEHNLHVHQHKDDETYRIIDVEEDLDKYLDLKIIFPNGLMLTKRESRHTKFGGMDEVMKTVRALDVRDLEAVRKRTLKRKAKK